MSEERSNGSAKSVVGAQRCPGMSSPVGGAFAGCSFSGSFWRCKCRSDKPELPGSGH
jgi:hypothetical protein